MDDKVYVVFGLTGSGKSTLLTAAACECLSGKSFLGLPPHPRVFSTFAIPETYKLEPLMLGKYDLTNSLLLIDEASQFFDAREWKTFPAHVRTFFQTHRHEHTSIIVCSQGFSDTDLRIRNLADKFWMLDKAPCGYSMCRPIVHRQRPNKGQIEETFEMSPPLYWVFINRKKYYHLFDSFVQNVSRETFTPEVYEGINDMIKPRIPIRQRIERLFAKNGKPPVFVNE